MIFGVGLQLQLKYSDIKQVEYKFDWKGLTDVPHRRIFSIVENDYNTDNYIIRGLIGVIYLSASLRGFDSFPIFFQMSTVIFILSIMVLPTFRFFIYRRYQYFIFAPVFENTDLAKRDFKMKGPLLKR